MNEKRLIGDDISTATAFVGERDKLKLSANADITDDARFNFSLSNGDYWRFNNLLAVNAKLVSILSLKASNVVRYVNAPVTGFDSTETITSIAVVAKFWSRSNSDESSRFPRHRCRAVFLDSAGSHAEHSVVESVSTARRSNDKSAASLVQSRPGRHTRTFR